MIFLSRCDNEYKVQFHLAEKVEPIPGCEEGLCDWGELKHRYAKTIDECSTDFCFKPNSVENVNVISSLTLFATFSFHIRRLIY